jgi:cytochrome c oxidase assembly factor CtaG
MSAPPDPASFTFEPLFAVLGAAAAVIYARAARIHRPGGWRIASFAAGIALIVLSVNSPLETLAVHYLLMAHLAQNALMADIAPLLVLLGLNQAMWEAAEARFPVIERVIAAWPLLLMLWLAAWYGVHFAPAYQYALRHPVWLNGEHLVLVVAGFLFWAPVVRSRWWDRSPALLVPYLVVAFVAASFLGLACTFIPDPFYAYYTEVPRLRGISAAEDQNLGGIIMNTEQAVVFLTMIGFLLFNLADREQRNAEQGRQPG